MKILIATDTYYPSVNGASYFTQRLAAFLARRGHRVFVMAPSKETKDSISTIDGVVVYGIRSVGTRFYPKLRFSLPLFINRAIKKYIQEISPDIIHIQAHFVINRVVFKVAKDFNIPIIGTNHFMPENIVHYLHLPKPAEEKLKKFGWRDFLNIYEKIDVVTTPTKTAAALLKQIGFKKEVIPVSCGIDLKRFNPRNDGSALKKKYGIPDDRLVLLYVGRLDREKMIEVLINALPQIAHSVPNVHLLIVGIGRLGKQLEFLAKKIGVQNKVTFTGFVPDEDFPNIYRIGHVFVIAGVAELQSLVTLEAMASGLPVIAVNAIALPELVHDGENGYLFPIGDSKTFAQCAIKILSNKKLRDTMSQNSLKIIQAHDINKTIDKYESLYLKAIKENIFKK